MLATGLSGLYCGLPSTRDLVVDDWQSPLPVIEKAVPELMTFIQALDFCNSVLQVSKNSVPFYIPSYISAKCSFPFVYKVSDWLVIAYVCC